MTYLLNVQKAIAQTFKPAPYGVADEYFLGWDEAGQDLTYGLSCGSEHALKQQIAAWLIEPNNPYFEDLDSESDKGYADRVKAIQLILEKTDEKF